MGSAIRSAAAFGWGRLFVEDRFGIWYGCDRVKRSEGRAAARRGRNPIRLIQTSRDRRYLFDEVVVLTTRKHELGKRAEELLHHTNLARGPKQLLVLPDESMIDRDAEDWQRLGKRIRFVNPGFSNKPSTYHFRLPASIALAEAARQVGWRTRPSLGRPSRHGPVFDQALSLIMKEHCEVVYLDELTEY